MMATGHTGDREIPQIVTRPERVGMIGARSADTIRARGHEAPHREAGHMTAPETPFATSKKSLHRGGRPHMTKLLFWSAEAWL